MKSAVHVLPPGVNHRGVLFVLCGQVLSSVSTVCQQMMYGGQQALDGIAKLLSTAAARYAPTEQQIQQSMHQ